MAVARINKPYNLQKKICVNLMLRYTHSHTFIFNAGMYITIIVIYIIAYRMPRAANIDSHNIPDKYDIVQLPENNIDFG